MSSWGVKKENQVTTPYTLPQVSETGDRYMPVNPSARIPPTNAKGKVVPDRMKRGQIVTTCVTKKKGKRLYTISRLWYSNFRRYYMRTKTHSYMIRLRPEHYNQLHSAAKKAGLTMAAYTRRALAASYARPVSKG